MGSDHGEQHAAQAEHLARIEGVRSLKTDIPMQTLKQSPALSLAPDPLRR